MTEDFILTCPTFGANSTLTHGFFTRNTPGTNNNYLLKDDNSVTQEQVESNRMSISKHLLASVRSLYLLKQTHSITVRMVDDHWSIGSEPEADAMVTDRPGIILGILTADCAPILFADEQKKVIAAAHAGWRGARNGIIEATVDAMEKKGANRANIKAVIGPCIHQASYEIGPEFYKDFLEEFQANKNFFKPSITKAGHHYFDLPGYVKNKLQLTGINQIHIIMQDTFAKKEDFYSYRRSSLTGEAYDGSNISVISI